MDSDSNRHPGQRLVQLFMMVLALGLLTGSSSQGIDHRATYQAKVYRTEGGIPHIRADDFASLGYGTGYAMAEDIFCLLADERFLTFSAERSRFLGPQNGNLQSDFFYQLFIDRGEAEESIDPRQAAVFRGAAAGYNRYLRDVGVDKLPDASCRGQEWVREIEAIDFRRVSRMNFFLPFVLNLIIAGQPPVPVVAASPAPPTPSTPPAPLTSSSEPANSPRTLSPEKQREIQLALSALLEPLQDKGSNGLGLGRDATVAGRGMLLANPHQGWTGVARFYAFHQMLPGEFNIVGANVIGRPQVGFGTTEHVAWTSTVSTAPRNTFYQLRLVPGNPTQYLFDGEPRDMIRETVTVKVPDGNGGFEDRSHTFYSTHFGAFLVGGFFPWNDFVAFAVRPALDGFRGVNSQVDQYQAKSVRELKAVHDAGQFLPVNLIAADSSGEALYADPGPIVNLTDAQLAACNVFGQIDGSRSECMWGTDPDSAAPGLFGPSNLPHLFRNDFVTNSNDSYWLTNPAEPITGLNSSLGSIETERTMRTRSGLAMVQRRLSGSDGQAGNRFTLEQLQTLQFANEAYTAQILLDGLVVLCDANPLVTLPDSSVVDVSEACPILADWDLHDDLDSRGAHLFREVMQAAGGSRVLPAAWNYLVPFDLNDPVNTPRDLDPDDNPETLVALATAVQRLRDAGIALDARLGDIQAVTRGGERIPVHGGTNASGIWNVLTLPFAGAAGYPEVSSGGSWIQATEFTADGPVSRGILTYSQSPNPDSPHFVDQTKLYSQKQWLDLPFTHRQVRDAAVSAKTLSEGKRDCKKKGWKAYTNPSFKNQGECVRSMNELRKKRLKEIRRRR